jgi:hypothetical protein
MKRTGTHITFDNRHGATTTVFLKELSANKYVARITIRKPREDGKVYIFDQYEKPLSRAEKNLLLKNAKSKPNFIKKKFKTGGKVKIGEWKVDKNGISWVLESIYEADFYNKYDGSYIIYNEKYGTKFIQPSEWKHNYKKSDDYAFKTGGVVYKTNDAPPMVINDRFEKNILNEYDLSLEDSKDIPFSSSKVSSSNSAFKIMNGVFPPDNRKVREYMYVLLLNRANKPIGFSQVSKGGISGTVADVQLVAGLAVKSGAKAIILAHNHPSGNTRPSAADIQVTLDMKEGLKPFRIDLLDHLILTPNDYSYTSFADEGIL